MSSRTTCFITFPTPAISHCARNSSDFPGGATDGRSRPGSVGERAIPIVDAGMRELWTTGWMHNRVRMIVASFLIKDLLIPWQEGASGFGTRWSTPTWPTTRSAGSGRPAAAPTRPPSSASSIRSFRHAKFDPEGSYVRHWVPELSALPLKYLYQPHKAPPEVLAAAGVRLGENYPRPIVSHADSRAAALAAFRSLRR